MSDKHALIRKRLRDEGDKLLAVFEGLTPEQLNYANPATQEAMIGELVRIAGQCDGVRCDMAMLVLPVVFERTWGMEAQSFWPKAIERVRERVPGLCFMAEVYWDLEWTLQQQGFDYTYDKRLYDRLRDGLPGRCVSISTQGWIIRTEWRAPWKTTMSRGRPRHYLRRFMRPRQ